MPNKKQNMTATKNNMAAQQKGAKPDYPDIDGDEDRKESMKQAAKDKNSNAAQQRGRANMAYQSAKVKASKNTKPKPKKKDKVDSAAQKTGKAKPTSNISKASLILNPNKKVFKNIEAKNNYNYKFEKEVPMPNMAAPMKGDYAAKMSDTDEGIEYRFGKQATADAKAAQQKGNPIMPNLNKKEYTDSGMNYRDANSNVVKGSQVDEGEISSVVRKSPERPYVVGGKDSMYANEKLYLDKAAKMVATHPSQQRMGNMVNKVATYNMPNVKAAQKKHHK